MPILKILTLIFLLFSSTSLLAANRVALVIGNNDYQQSPLKNPVNDASAIGKLLSKLGFKVVPAYNVDRDGMEEALDEFGEQAEKAEIALIYYAGHAIQVDGVNYLIPANTPVENRRHLRKLINLNDLVTEAQYAKGLGLVLLDACRDNPFGQNLQRSLGRSIGGRGLARIEDTPSHILVGFATKEDTTAADGQANHSPYATALLKYLPQKNLEIRHLFGEVNDAVKQATGQQQQPYTYGSLGRTKWYLAGNTVVPPLPPENDDKPSAFPEPEMIAIKGGCFQMGQTDAEKQWLIQQSDQAKYDKYFSNESKHKVCVDAFELGKYEVTVGEFRKFTQATAYKTAAEKDSDTDCRTWKDQRWQWVVGRDWKKTGFVQNDQHPVVCVSWQDASAYTQWLSKQTKRSYRLPTEAEWEYAARAGTKTMRYWGNDYDNKKACDYANVADQTAKDKYHWSATFSCHDAHPETASVGMFKANQWGLKDMLGNVWEWTCSAYPKEADYNGLETKCTNSNDSHFRVLRGAAWNDVPWNVRSAYRYRFPASIPNSNVGFRLSRTR